MNFDWDAFLPHVIHDVRAILRESSTKSQLLDRRWEDAPAELRALLHDSIAAQANLDHFIRRIGAFHEALSAPPSEFMSIATIVKLVHLSRKDRLRSLGAELEIGELCEASAPASLQAVLEELLDNSMTFVSPERPLRVRIHAQRDDSSVRITISDNGSGWESGLDDRLFLPLERLDPRGGFGLGLAIARALVERAGGNISGATTSSGSVFAIELPLTGA
jgi:light-regulated signal transduction histidine kinase (bacteriophytochrome)